MTGTFEPKNWCNKKATCLVHKSGTPWLQIIIPGTKFRWKSDSMRLAITPSFSTSSRYWHPSASIFSLSGTFLFSLNSRSYSTWMDTEVSSQSIQSQIPDWKDRDQIRYKNEISLKAHGDLLERLIDQTPFRDSKGVSLASLYCSQVLLLRPILFSRLDRMCNRWTAL